MADLDTDADPLALFATWLSDAETSEIDDPNAMALATVDAGGLPNVRMVLLKDFDASGFVFYGSRQSQKGVELAAIPRAALCFHWKSIGRQVRIRGEVTEVSPEEADAYFKTRPKGSRIGAWASQQSRPLKSRFALEKAVTKFTAKYGLGHVPRPNHWTGYRLAPSAIEFWSRQTFRLHDRIAFERQPDGSWAGMRLYP